MNEYKKINAADDAAKLRMRNRRLTTVPATVPTTDELKKLSGFLGAKTVPVKVREISEWEMAG